MHWSFMLLPEKDRTRIAIYSYLFAALILVAIYCAPIPKNVKSVSTQTASIQQNSTTTYLTTAEAAKAKKIQDRTERMIAMVIILVLTTIVSIIQAKEYGLAAAWAPLALAAISLVSLVVDIAHR